MGMEYSETRRRVNEDGDYFPRRSHREELYDDGIESSRMSSRHRSTDLKKFRREERDHSDKDRERSKISDGLKERESETQDLQNDWISSRGKNRDRRREDCDVFEKDRSKDKARDNDYERGKNREKGREKDKEKRNHGKERDRGKERELEKDVEWDREKDKIKEKNKDRDKERHKENNRVKAKDPEDERSKEYENDRYQALLEINNGKERVRVRDRDDRKEDQDRERPRDRDKVANKSREDGGDGQASLDIDDKSAANPRKSYDHYEDEASNIQHVRAEVASGEVHSSSLVERISKMKDDRLKKKSSGGSEILSWVSKSRQDEEKRKAEKEKALQLSRIFEEQDNVDQGGNEDDEDKHSAEYLAGVKVLHGLDKVVEGGAVVLTLKDQNILADGGINEDIDMLENVEIGEQKRRDEAYNAAKMKTGLYVDKFNDEPGSEKKILPQYDDIVKDEGITLDERGQFSGEAEKKLEELRRKIYGVPVNNKYDDLSSSGKNSSDYYTQEEMLQFKKPKKRKSLRKKEKLDIDALEADAIASGLGVGDLGSRNDGKRQAILKEKENSEAEMRNNAYQSACAKADEASKALRPVQFEAENSVFGNGGDDDDDLSKSLERARKLAFQKKDAGAVSGPKAVALLASVISSNHSTNNPSSTAGDTQENKVIFTEMDEFVWGLQHDQGREKGDNSEEDVFMEEDLSEEKNEKGWWKEVNENGKNEGGSLNEPHIEVNVTIDESIREAEVGKGLSGALHLLKERGALKDSVDWGGRNMDKKKSKLVGLHHSDGTKEINIERTDEFGRILTPKEAFRLISHKFHGKGPGKMKQEKHIKQYYEELKLKQMRNSDTPSLSVERMREAQARLKTPYLVLSGNVKHGQGSDPEMIEKDLPGSLTPMLGDRKVEHFLGIVRK